VLKVRDNLPDIIDRPVTLCPVADRVHARVVSCDVDVGHAANEPGDFGIHEHVILLPVGEDFQGGIRYLFDDTDAGGLIPEILKDQQRDIVPLAGKQVHEQQAFFVRVACLVVDDLDRVLAFR